MGCLVVPGQKQIRSMSLKGCLGGIRESGSGDQEKQESPGLGSRVAWLAFGSSVDYYEYKVTIAPNGPLGLRPQLQAQLASGMQQLKDSGSVGDRFLQVHVALR